MKNVILVCTALRFYAPNDEVALFERLRKITCISEIKGVGKELHISIASSKISDDELRDLLGIFKRYNFENSKQLEVFKDVNNAYWFED